MTKIMNDEFYILKVKNQNKIEYLSIDSTSGGYPCFLNDFNMAKKFKTKEDVDEFLNRDPYINNFPEIKEKCEIRKITIYEEEAQ